MLEAFTLRKFRRLLETHSLTQVIFETTRNKLACEDLLLREDVIVDAMPPPHYRLRATSRRIIRIRISDPLAMGAHQRRPGLGAGAHDAHLADRHE